MVLKMPPEQLFKISRLKFSIICNATIEPFDLYLKAEAFKYDLFLDIHIADHYRTLKKLCARKAFFIAAITTFCFYFSRRRIKP